MKNLAELLVSYSQKDYYPFHMPGHKRNPFSVGYEPSIETDITEIDGFDNLHHAQGILQKAQERAAKLYQAAETIYSVNGSTAALLSAISASTKIKGQILVARNCHKAVYHAMYLRQLRPVYLYPKQEQMFGLNGGILPEDVRAALTEHPDIEAVVLTSPTYDGIVSDVAAIAKIAHEYGIPVIVDEAHGAHFPFYEKFPASALTKGADIVIVSLHKTLPSMTQTALLHRNSDRVSSKLLHRYMGIYQSSSPSYPLMASMDACISQLSECAEERFEAYGKRLNRLYGQLSHCKCIRPVTAKIVGKSAIYDWDFSKIILSVRNTTITGQQLHQILRNRYHLEMEMESCSYVLGITSIADTEEGFERLAKAVLEIDEELSKDRKGQLQKQGLPDSYGSLVLFEKIGYAQAMDCEVTYVDISEISGQICGELLSLYPPGIPLAVPGEVFSEELAEYMKQCEKAGLEIQGLNARGQVGVIYG